MKVIACDEVAKIVSELSDREIITQEILDYYNGGSLHGRKVEDAIRAALGEVIYEAAYRSGAVIDTLYAKYQGQPSIKILYKVYSFDGVQSAIA